MRWQSILAEVETLNANTTTDPDILDVTYNSRQVSEGALLVAMRGDTTDGNRFLRQALDAGATAILTDSRESFAFLDSKEFPVALVSHGRRALALASAAVFSHPERHLSLTAVTGTNGKTTTAYLTESLLAHAGRKTVLLGTIEARICGKVLPADHTTPESRDILALFRSGRNAGATEAVMEMSSHALEQERVYGLPVDVAIFTNLTQDHLDFHGTMQHYAEAKSRLFAGVGAASPRIAILNRDDPYFSTMAEAALRCGTRWTYGLNDAKADFYATDMEYTGGHTGFTLRCPFGHTRIESSLTGRVNVYNLLAAIAASLGRGLSLDEVTHGVSALRPVPGRFETVANDLGVTVVVDYAHTDDALRNLIVLARELTPAGRVLTLFGCGGDRDRTKRARMGRAAAEGSDFVLVTSDNPRSEDPARIAAEAVTGLRESGFSAFAVELDRAVAISLILAMATPGDTVLIAGKGHEKTQTALGVATPFNDVAVAAAVLRELEAENIQTR